MTTRLLTWDWRGQPNLQHLAKAVHDLSGGRVSLYEVDTGSDQYAIVLADEPLTAEQAASVWDAQFDEEN